MIIVITETNVRTFRSFAKLNKELDLQKHELTKIGKDYVCNMTDETFEVSKDIKLLESVASKKVFTKETMDMTNWLQIITLITVFIMMK